MGAIPKELCDDIKKLYMANVPVSEICRLYNLPRNKAWYIIRKPKPTDPKQRKRKHILKPEDYKVIGEMLAEDYKLHVIGKRLGFNKATISKAISRCGGRDNYNYKKFLGIEEEADYGN